MTGQIPDTITCKKKKYDLLGYEGKDGSELFIPEEHGFFPQPLHTACWRGYFCGYKIARRTLYLDTLCISDGNDHYPPINGAQVTPGRSDGPVYKKINLLVPFTGFMRVGADFNWDHYIHMGFQKPSAYGIVWDLEFSEGKVANMINISRLVQEIEGQYHDEYHHRDLWDRIGDAFSRDMELR